MTAVSRSSDLLFVAQILAGKANQWSASAELDGSQKASPKLFGLQLDSGRVIAYIYPAETLHCTICTLRAFTAGPLEPDAMSRWRPVLDAARALPTWPQGAFRLKMGPPTLEGAAAIFRFEDDGAIAAMRSSLREAICSAGGVAAEGCDRSKAKPLPGTAEGDPPPHLPDIVHSTVLRWTAEPSESDLEAARAAFASTSWEPLEVAVSTAKAVIEDIPYMHIPDDPAHTWWRWDA
ncbi:unnamed protein product [Effrenium voratum]|nr:unnamed protein product [Effrenium voratum]